MNQSSPQSYDAIIIGAGQSGKPLALAMAGKGWKTAVIERRYLGGSCINYGCTPTKTMIASAQAAHLTRRAADFGVYAERPQVDIKKVKERKDAVVHQFRKSIADSFAEAENLTLIYGEARFTGTDSLEVALNEGGNLQLRSGRIFIDTGTRPLKPPFAGADDVPWLDSTSIMDLEELPGHLLIAGGGYIGLEFGQMFRRFGSEVSIIERGNQLLSREDPDIAAEMRDILEAEGIRVYLNAEIRRVSRDDSQSIVLQLAESGNTQTISGSHLLIAMGSVPNTEALNLEAARLETDEKGYIQVNERLETSQKGIYAMGDVKGGPAFTHVSYDDYRVLSQNLLEEGKSGISDRMVPYTVFTDPQLGRIGLSEEQARKAGYRIKIARLPMKYAARAIETGNTRGVMKAVIDADSDQILGAAILGMEGGEIMSVIQVAMMGKLPYTRLRDAVFAHPTLAESLNSLFMKTNTK